MCDYSKSVIYLLRHKDDIELQNVYIGSTKDFKNRKKAHKSACNNLSNNENYNLKVYQYIRENGGWDNWVMKIIEEYSCNSLEELTTKEDEIMLQYPNRLNTFRAKGNMKEYLEDNKDKIKEKRKIYLENNKEKIKKTSKKYYEDNKEKRKEKITCECGCIVRKSHLERHKKSQKHINIMKLSNQN
jgi:hypothetical protein